MILHFPITVKRYETWDKASVHLRVEYVRAVFELHRISRDTAIPSTVPHE